MATKKYLYLVRHGETVTNAGQIHAGQYDAALTPLGRAQAAAAAPLLSGIHFDTVFSSDLSRAKDTCAIMLPDATPILRPDIRETNVGSLVGKTGSEAFAEHGEVYLTATRERDYAAFGGESNEAFEGRVLTFFDDIANGDYGEHVIAFCHGGVIQAAARRLLESPAPVPYLAVSNCSISTFYYNGERWSIRGFNCLPELPR